MGWCSHPLPYLNNTMGTKHPISVLPPLPPPSLRLSRADARSLSLSRDALYVIQFNAGNCAQKI